MVRVSDPVEIALSRALEANTAALSLATNARDLGAVRELSQRGADLARELEARRVARSTNVVQLDPRRRPGQ